MPKPKSLDPGVSKNISIPQSVVEQVDALLYSQIESRVPHGAYSRLVTMLLRDWLGRLPALTPASTGASLLAELSGDAS